MIDSTAQANNFGFENLTLQGWKDQRTAAASAVRDGRGTRQKDEVLSTGQQRQIDQLKATDRKVRAHEQAHMAAGGELVQGGASYSYQTGPDRRRYAVAGEVSIDISKAAKPEETISKAERIRQAALAPIDPSPQDRRVAAYASQLELQARQELAQKAAEERTQAGSRRSSEVIRAYQLAGGVEKSTGFSAQA